MFDFPLNPTGSNQILPLRFQENVQIKTLIRNAASMTTKGSL